MNQRCRLDINSFIFRLKTKRLNRIKALRLYNPPSTSQNVTNNPLKIEPHPKSLSWIGITIRPFRSRSFANSGFSNATGTFKTITPRAGHGWPYQKVAEGEFSAAIFFFFYYQKSSSIHPSRTSAGGQCFSSELPSCYIDVFTRSNSKGSSFGC